MVMSNNLINILKKFIFLFIFSIFIPSLLFADVMEFEFGTYSGESFFGRPHGRGEFVWNEGDSFSGQWVHGSREGRGKQIFEDGSILVGMYKDDLANGKGKFTFTKTTSDTHYNVEFKDIETQETQIHNNLPIVDEKGINDLIGEDNPFGININNSIGAFVDRTTHEELFDFIEKFKVNDGSTKGNKIDSTIDMIKEGLLPTIQDILYYIATNQHVVSQ